jgi:hypothetical protein
MTMPYPSRQMCIPLSTEHKAISDPNVDPSFSLILIQLLSSCSFFSARCWFFPASLHIWSLSVSYPSAHPSPNLMLICL